MALGTPIPISLATLTDTNRQVVVPAPAGATGVILNIDRTVGAAPLNGVPGATLTLTVECSWDNQATWRLQGSSSVRGGVLIDPETSLTVTFSEMAIQHIPANATHARITIAVAGTFSCSGTLTVV